MYLFMIIHASYRRFEVTQFSLCLWPQIVNFPSKSSLIKGAIQSAITTFAEIGQQIAKENEEYRVELNLCVKDIKGCGKSFCVSAEKFSENPLEMKLRSTLVQYARELLSSVTKMLILADFIDVQNLLKSINKSEKVLSKLKHSQSKDELDETIR